jgi:hypothetical protein
MTQNPASLTQLRVTPSRTYSNTAAVNDTQAPLTSPRVPRGLDVGDIGARTGRSLVPARIKTESAGTDERGFAFAGADCTYVRVSQNPDNPGVWVHVWSMNDTETSGLVLRPGRTGLSESGGAR